MAAKALPAEPISTPNITPLIDVLLVLLIMMILTIPAMTHSVKIDLPVTQEGKPPPPMALKHQLDISATGTLTLDGVAVDEASLAGRIAPIAADDNATLTLNTDASAPYGTVERVLATIKRGGVTRLGFAGHDRFANSF